MAINYTAIMIAVSVVFCFILVTVGVQWYFMQKELRANITNASRSAAEEEVQAQTTGS